MKCCLVKRVLPQPQIQSLLSGTCSCAALMRDFGEIMHHAVLGGLQGRSLPVCLQLFACLLRLPFTFFLAAHHGKLLESCGTVATMSLHLFIHSSSTSLIQAHPMAPILFASLTTEIITSNSQWPCKQYLGEKNQFDLPLFWPHSVKISCLSCHVCRYFFFSIWSFTLFLCHFKSDWTYFILNLTRGFGADVNRGLDLPFQENL